MQSSRNDLFSDTFQRIATAQDPWDEMIVVLGEHRERNRQMGGDDILMCRIIAAQAVLLDLPVVPGDRK